MRAVVLALISLLLPLMAGHVNAKEVADFSERRLLLLYSYHPMFPTSPKVLEGLLSEFGELPPVIEIEYMDSKRVHSAESMALFKQQLAFKLSAREPYDVVVTADDNALNFMLEEGKQLLPGVPVVFLGVNNLELATELELNPKVTGVVEAVSIRETIELADALFPEMATLHILVDGTTSGSSDLASTLALQQTFPELSFDVINLAELSWAEFANEVGSLPKRDVALLLSAYRDKNQEGLSFESSLELIVDASSVPIFHPFEHGMGEGVFGGVLISHKEQARQAAIKVKKVFAGELIADIPILTKSPNIAVADKRVMDEFGVTLAQLPSQAEVRFHKPSLWRQYWKEISVAVTFMALMMVIIIILALQNRVRARFAKTLAQSETRLRTILDNIDAYIYMKDPSGHYLFANKLMLSLFHRPANDVVAKSDKDLFSETEALKREVSDRKVMASQQLFKEEELAWNPVLSSLQQLDTTKIPLINDSGDTYALCAVSLDVTEQKEYEKQLKQIAHYDQLTGLPNRVLFSDRLEQAMKQAERLNQEISVLYLDLDEFKEINDSYGHVFGDRLLRKVSARIEDTIRESDTAARLGGDEFIVLLVNAGMPEDDLEITQRILGAVSEPMVIEGAPVSVSASIGITRYPQAKPLEADHLLRQADQAMYIAKNMGRNRFHFFDAEIEMAALQQEVLITEVKRALEANEFRLFYQPKVALATGEVVGFEALIRWQHPEKGLLPPNLFLPSLEKHSVMVEIDEWVINEALRQLQEWQSQGQTIPVSINLSHMFFKQRNLVQLLTQELERYPDVAPSLLGLEILETQALDNLTEVAAVLLECQKLGVYFSLDDFGTGFSSLTYLKQLPINLLKVDRSFVINMLEDEEDRSILEGILALCHAFNIKAIAEGVETLEHGAELKKMGYHFAQGYGISRPMPAHDVKSWNSQWSAPQQWRDV